MNVGTTMEGHQLKGVAAQAPEQRQVFFCSLNKTPKKKLVFSR